jgi:hypothetical protein
MFGLIIMSATMSRMARAQSSSHLRALAVYEYTGNMGKPSRSRLVPVAVWDGTQFQPAGLYLADPEPLAVEPGTLYELMRHGIGVGQIEVNQPEETASGWIGMVHFLPDQKPRPAKLKLPSYLTESKGFASDRPHFAYTPPKSTGVAGPVSPSKTDAGSGRPELHSRETPAEEGRPMLHETEGEPPTLHHPSPTVQGDASLTSRAAAPDRPRLFYGKPRISTSSEKQDVLKGEPANLRWLVAVSDPEGTGNHSYAWSWSSAAEEAEAKSEMEDLARRLLVSDSSGVNKKSVSSKGTATLSHAFHAIALTAEHFHAFQLSWGSGVVYVFSARTDDPEQQTRYITIIARPDFNGSLLTLYRKITPAPLLDYQSRMRLIDAVDATGNGQADLLFELLTRRQRRFALFQAGATEAQPVFVTEPQ